MSTFTQKAKQAEAKSNLSHIYTLQASFFIDEKRYGRFGGDDCDAPTEIGFEAICKRNRYQYMIESVGPTHFVAVARERVVKGERRLFPGCDSPLDEWVVNEKKELTARFDATKVCPEATTWRDMSFTSLRQLSFGVIVLLGLAFAIAAVAFLVFLTKKPWKLALINGVTFALFAAPSIVLGLFCLMTVLTLVRL